RNALPIMLILIGAGPGQLISEPIPTAYSISPRRRGFEMVNRNKAKAHTMEPLCHHVSQSPWQ
ncbi:MAG: hypothetical protein ACKO9A_10240, partial [Alphaproteobacteria bacterium]